MKDIEVEFPVFVIALDVLRPLAMRPAGTDLNCVLLFTTQERANSWAVEVNALAAEIVEIVVADVLLRWTDGPDLSEVWWDLRTVEGKKVFRGESIQNFRLRIRPQIDRDLN